MLSKNGNKIDVIPIINKEMSKLSKDFTKNTKPIWQNVNTNNLPNNEKLILNLKR